MRSEMVLRRKIGCPTAICFVGCWRRLRERSTSPPPVLKTLQTPCCGASPTQTLQHCGWTASPLCNSKKLSVKRVFSRRSCRSSNIAVVGEAQDRCYFRVNSTQLVLIHAFAFGQVTAFIQARSHYTAKFEALSSSRNEPRSSNQSTHCSEVTLRRCPAGASRYMN